MKDKTFYFFSTEITRREESGFSVIGGNNFGLTNIDVSKFFRGSGGCAMRSRVRRQQKAFFAGVPAATPGVQQYVALVGSSSSLALTGANPAFLQADDWGEVTS